MDHRPLVLVVPEEECLAAAVEAEEEEGGEEAAEIMAEVPLLVGGEALAEEAGEDTVLPEEEEEAAEVAAAGDLLRLETICRCPPTAAETEEVCRRTVAEGDTEMTTVAIVDLLLRINIQWKMLAHTEIAEIGLMARPRHQCRQEDHRRHMEKTTDTMIFAATTARLRVRPRARTEAMVPLQEVLTAATETTAHLEGTSIVTALPDSRIGMILPPPPRRNTVTTIVTRDLPDLVTAADTATAESSLEDRTLNIPISRRCHPIRIRIRISSMADPLDLVTVAAARHPLR